MLGKPLTHRRLSYPLQSCVPAELCYVSLSTALSNVAPVLNQTVDLPVPCLRKSPGSGGGPPGKQIEGRDFDFSTRLTSRRSLIPHTPSQRLRKVDVDTDSNEKQAHDHLRQFPASGAGDNSFRRIIVQRAVERHAYQRRSRDSRRRRWECIPFAQTRSPCYLPSIRHRHQQPGLNASLQFFRRLANTSALSPNEGSIEKLSNETPHAAYPTSTSTNFALAV